MGRSWVNSFLVPASATLTLPDIRLASDRNAYHRSSSDLPVEASGELADAGRPGVVA